MNYTLLLALLVCVVGMLTLCKSSIQDLGEWNGAFRAKTTARSYKLEIQQINENEIQFSLYVNGIRKLHNVTATLADNDMAVYDDGHGFTMIMRLEEDCVAVTNDLSEPFDRFERITV